MLTRQQRTGATAGSTMGLCAQCGEISATLLWSEPAGERRIRHLWACTVCGCAFETQARFPAAGVKPDDGASGLRRSA